MYERSFENCSTDLAGFVVLVTVSNKVLGNDKLESFPISLWDFYIN